MAVAEAKRADRDDAVASSGAPPWLAKSVGIVPRKFGELRTFMTEVRTEMKKVTWPSRQEVRATTIVVIATTFFFGFYLYGLDLGFTWVVSQILKK